MTRPSRPRKTAKLSDSVHRQLNSYALAAGAAGVGILALVPRSQAKVVYTAAHITIPGFTPVPLDLNHDGVNDLSFYWVTSSRDAGIAVTAPQQNGVFGYSTFRGQCAAFALKRKVRVGPKDGFENPNGLIKMWQEHFSTTGRKTSLGQWYNVDHRYLGVKFAIKGKTHYGWVRLNVMLHTGGFNAVITGYAYETTPNRLIVTGKTNGPADSELEKPNESPTDPAARSSTLGMLAGGAPALSIWRRTELIGPEHQAK